MRGRAITSDDGPVFFNQPRAGASDGSAPLLMGGGADRPMANPSSRRRSPKMHRLLLSLRDRFYPELHGTPPAAEWVGPMAFTPDQLPAIGFLRPGVVVAAGYSGYGGSYTTAAGAAAAVMALTATVPDWVPEDVFSPRRLLTDEALFMTRHDSLLRIGNLLCRQLRVVNQRIADALTLTDDAGVAAASGRIIRPRRTAAGAIAIEATALTALPLFAHFTVTEARVLIRAARRWTLDSGTVLFAQGSAAGSCYAIVEGEIGVSVGVNGHEQLLATLPVGSVFGQVSVFDGKPRSATCTVFRRAVLLEWTRHACARLLGQRSPIALKLLQVLNTGLITALRRADRQLLRLESGATDAFSMPRPHAE